MEKKGGRKIPWAGLVEWLKQWEHLASKPEALSSKPAPPKKKKEREKSQCPYTEPSFLCHLQSLVCDVQLAGTEHPVRTAAGQSRNTTFRSPSGGLGCQHWRQSLLHERPSSGLASRTRTCDIERGSEWGLCHPGFCFSFFL
jgi:hypothetical protein